jgi:hypothetical protein
VQKMANSCSFSVTDFERIMLVGVVVACSRKGSVQSEGVRLMFVDFLSPQTIACIYGPTINL